jgi:hypothetical protein
VFPDILGIDFLAACRACGRVQKGASFEWMISFSSKHHTRSSTSPSFREEFSSGRGGFPS